jgi:hypothetical protein
LVLGERVAVVGVGSVATVALDEDGSVLSFLLLMVVVFAMKACKGGGEMHRF